MNSEQPSNLSGNVADLDIYRAAKIMIDYYGDEAGIRAALRADNFYNEGDVEGSKTWCRILQAVKSLLKIPAPDEIQ